MISRSSLLQSAKSQQKYFILKLDLELWQLFTVLTVIFSIASTFMWLGLVNPKNLKEEVVLVDRSKAFLYNQYQEDYTRLQKIQLLQTNLNIDTCSVDQKGDKNSLDLVDSTIQDSRSKVVEHLKTKPAFTSNNLVSKSSNSYINLLDSLNETTARVREFEITKSKLFNQIFTLCKSEVSTVSKQEVLESLDKMGISDINDRLTQQIVTIKNNVNNSNVDTPSKLLAQLSPVNDLNIDISSLVFRSKGIENEFIDNIKLIEQWERTIISQNPRLSVNLIFIYDA